MLTRRGEQISRHNGAGLVRTLDGVELRHNNGNAYGPLNRRIKRSVQRSGVGISCGFESRRSNGITCEAGETSSGPWGTPQTAMSANSGPRRRLPEFGEPIGDSKQSAAFSRHQRMTPHGDGRVTFQDRGSGPVGCWNGSQPPYPIPVLLQPATPLRNSRRLVNFLKQKKKILRIQNSGNLRLYPVTQTKSPINHEYTTPPCPICNQDLLK